MRTLFLVMTVMFIAGCSSNRQPATIDDNSDSSIVQLNADTDTIIPVVQPTIQPVEDEIHLAGKIDFDPNLITRVSSLVNGTIVNVRVQQGAVVHKGDVLAEEYSSDFAGAVSDMEKAAAQLKTATQNFERANQLATSNVISQRELQQAGSDAAQAQAEYYRSEQVMKLLSGSTQSESAILSIKAPIDGIVLERLAQIGSQVRSDNSQSLFTIGRIGSVWAILDAYQNQLTDLSVGDKVLLKFDGIDDTTLTSTISYISPIIDPATLTAKVRCIINNRDGKIKPAMFCTATIYHSNGNALFLPSTAVFLGSDGRTYVFVQLKKNKFQKREVSIGKTTSNVVEILSGISTHDNIVMNQALFLNEELLSGGKE
jgi:cobalt-zinc-cadmium efflux system membrane fusion protein